MNKRAFSLVELVIVIMFIGILATIAAMSVEGEINPLTSRLTWTVSCMKRIAATGMVAGFLSGLLGIGGGFVIVPSLLKISSLGRHLVVATSLAAIALISATSVIIYASLGMILWQVALPFVAAVLVGGLIGRRFSYKIPSHMANPILGVMSLVVALITLVYWSMSAA